MNKTLTTMLSRAVHGRLDYLDRLICRTDDRPPSSLADVEIARLTVTLRDLLNQHGQDDRGRCRECSGLFRRRAHPCSVWTVAHQHLVANCVEPTGPAATRRHPGARVWRR
jgi:hypothetical protein